MKTPFRWPKNLLMVRPNGFRVDYAINPYMRDAQGNLKTVHQAKALQQWEELRATFIRLGLNVETLEGSEDFPDMVFCANQTLPVRTSSGKLTVVLSRMHAPERQGEIPFFRKWCQLKQFSTLEVTALDFEGAGDAICNFETGEFLGGYGFRTDRRAYEMLGEKLGVRFETIELVSEDFYHLDTCFAVLNQATAAFVPEAFTQEGRDKMRALYPKLIPIDRTEALTFFAGNCTSVDGHHIVLQAGAEKFNASLKAHGFTPVEVETSEFMKAGGSVFCMKQFF